MPVSTLVTSLQDEAPYILEWVAYHRSLGFDRIVVLAHDCGDGSHEILSRLNETGAVSYERTDVPAGSKPRAHALKRAGESHEVRSADFVMVLLPDEFLVVKSAPHRLGALLEVLKDRSADRMVIPRRIFGASGKVTFKDRPVIERFTRSMDVSDLPKTAVRTLFRQAGDLRMSIHFPQPVAGASWIDAGGRALSSEGLTWNGGTWTIHRDLAEIAHYGTKSLDEYLLKLCHGDRLDEEARSRLEAWRRPAQNRATDLDVIANAPRFRPELDRLMADPVLAELHRNAVAARSARLARILAKPQMRKLYGRLAKPGPAVKTPAAPVAPAARPDERAGPAAAGSSGLRIGIMTLPMNRNYGGNLQAFALMQSLRKLGHSPVLLNRRHNPTPDGPAPDETAPNETGDPAQTAQPPLYGGAVGLGKNIPNRAFVEQHLAPISQVFHSSAAMRRQSPRYGFDAVITGSDQVWRPRYAKDALPDFFLGFLDHADRRTRRISYAASFGSEKNEYSPKDRAMAARLLRGFDAVSVREDSAVGMCRKMFGVEARHVLDPTMLLTKEDYIGLLAGKPRSPAAGQLLAYVLDASPGKLELIGKIATSLSIEPRSTNGQPLGLVDTLKTTGGDKSVEGWLAAFRDAAYVATDSFHGVAFSIIFNKPFVAYGNPARGLARFKSLLKLVGLEDRLVVTSEGVTIDAFLRPVDWDRVNERLAVLRAQSLSFLTDALPARSVRDRPAPASQDGTKRIPVLARRALPSGLGAPVQGTDSHPLNVHCTGCGACVSESCGALKMAWSRDGFLEPQATRADIPATAVQVCPFNPAPDSVVEDEDALARLCLPQADRFDPRLGRFVGTYIGYSKVFRPSSSSGGLATYVFEQLLRRGHVDHLFVVGKAPDGQYAYQIVGKETDIRATSKTRYFPVSMERLFELIETTEGRIAVSGVACFIKAIRLKQHYHPELKDKIPFLSGIICGGLKSRFYTDFLAQSTGIKGPYRDTEYRLKNPKSLSSDYSFAATDRRGKERRVRMQKLGDMWGTGLFKSRACDFCTDVMTELADISLGDAWLPEYKQDGMGNSVIVTRTPLADRIVREGIESGALQVAEVAPGMAARTQSGGFNHKQKGVRIRLLMERLGGGSRALPFVRPRVLSDSPIAEIFVQLLRERTRAKSHRVWQQTGDAQIFLHRMRPTLRQLKAVTLARKHNGKIQTAALNALRDPSARVTADADIAAIRPVLRWVRDRLRDGRIDESVVTAALPDLPATGPKQTGKPASRQTEALKSG